MHCELNYLPRGLWAVRLGRKDVVRCKSVEHLEVTQWPLEDAFADYCAASQRFCLPLVRVSCRHKTTGDLPCTPPPHKPLLVSFLFWCECCVVPFPLRLLMPQDRKRASTPLSCRIVSYVISTSQFQVLLRQTVQTSVSASSTAASLQDLSL